MKRSLRLSKQLFFLKGTAMYVFSVRCAGIVRPICAFFHLTCDRPSGISIYTQYVFRLFRVSIHGYSTAAVAATVEEYRILVGDPNDAASRTWTRIARLLGLVVAAFAKIVCAGVGYDCALFITKVSIRRSLVRALPIQHLSGGLGGVLVVATGKTGGRGESGGRGKNVRPKRYARQST
jgi:hypothetical protein